MKRRDKTEWQGLLTHPHTYARDCWERPVIGRREYYQLSRRLANRPQNVRLHENVHFSTSMIACHSFEQDAQWLECPTGNRKTQVRMPAGLRCVFSSDPSCQFFYLCRRRGKRVDDLQNYCLGTRRGIAADRGRPAVGFVYIPNGKLVHFIFSLLPFSSENHAPKGPERKINKPRCC